MKRTQNKIHREEIRNEIVFMKKRMRTLSARLEKLPELKHRMKLFLSEWVSLDKREILEVYPHKSSPEGICVLVNGYDGEKGDFWAIDEISGDKKII